jgi:hypothetical protein
MSNLPVSLGTVSDVMTSDIVVPPIDYTSRDYASLINDLLNLVPSYLPEWTDRSPGDFGIVLLELFAYVGDILNYYSDRIANEAFIGTAQQRQSVLNIANLLDYTPHGNVAATCLTQFSIQSPAPTPVLIPAHTQIASALSGIQQIIFETTQDLWIFGDGISNIKTVTSNGQANQQIVLSDPSAGYPTYNFTGGSGNQSVTVGGTAWTLAPGNTFVGQPGTATMYTVIGGNPNAIPSIPPNIIKFGNGTNGTIPANGSAIVVTYQPAAPNNYQGVVSAIHGATNAGEGIGISDGTPNQQFTLFSTPVVDGSVVVYVNEGGSPVKWKYYQRIVDAFSSEAAYTYTTDANGVVTIQFGDNVAGRVPAPGAFITADYMVGGGAIGNVATNSLTQLMSGPDAVIAVTNTTPATGGADVEATDHIRIHAPLSISAINRAVSLDDYAALVLNIPSIAKASAMSTAYNAVNIYVHPAGNFLMTGPSDTTGQSALTNRVNALLPSITNVGLTGYLDDKKMVGTSIVVLPPQYNNAGTLSTGYVPVCVNVTVQVLPQYHASTVQAAVQAAIYNLFLFSVVDFGSRVSLSTLYHAIMSLEGVDYVSAASMWRNESPGSPGDIVCAPYEIPMAYSVAVTTTGGIIY